MIQKTVCDFFEVPVEKLKEPTRKRQYVQARQLSMFLPKEYTKSSLKSIGNNLEDVTIVLLYTPAKPCAT